MDNLRYAYVNNVSLCQLKDHRSLYESYVPMKYKRYYKRMAKYVFSNWPSLKLLYIKWAIVFFDTFSSICIKYSPSLRPCADLENGVTMLPYRQLLIRFVMLFWMRFFVGCYRLLTI